MTDVGIYNITVQITYMKVETQTFYYIVTIIGSEDIDAIVTYPPQLE